MNKLVDQKSASTKNEKSSKKVWQIAALTALVLALIWIIFTVVAPLIRGTGINKYSGLQKDMATAIVDLAKLYNGPQSPTLVPNFVYQVSVGDIHPVTQQEIDQYCKDDDPEYISNDSTNPRYYTAVVTEQYLLGLPKTTLYVGCDPRDYIHIQVFGIPEKLDTRTHMNVTN
jgi:hypothetical protein